MKNKGYLIIAAILLVVLPIFASSLAVTVGDNQPWDKFAFSSSFKLNLFANEAVSYYIQYTDSDFTSLSLFLYDKNGALLETKSCTSSPCGGSFAKVITADNYSLTIMPPTAGGRRIWNRINGQNGYTAGPYKFPVGEVNIFGNSNLRSSSILIQQTSVLQYFRMHKIYVAADSTNLQLVLKNLVPQQIAFINGVYWIVTLYQQGNLNELVSIINQNAFTQSATQLLLQYSLPSQGYYWIVVDANFHTDDITTPADFPTWQTDSYKNGWTYSIEYSTDRYECPYDQSYPDVTGIYQGCLFPASVNTFPCLVFDDDLQICSQCINGYTLSAGACLENNCTAGQYKRYGVCYALPPNCVSFNPLFGCSQCKDSTYQIINKTCVRIPLNCTGRNFYDAANYVCASVSATCGTFDANNGNCLTCISSAYQLTNGSCKLIPIPTCQDRQYALNGLCYNVDSLCSIFQFLGGKCLACIRGFNLVNATCVQIQCQDRYVPDIYGNCKLVSPLCKVYNQFGFCLTCIDGYSVDPTGECLQVYAPHPCPARQYLGIDNQCQINQFCNATNAWDNSCASCSAGYYLLYTGQCVPQVNCKPRQYIINNQCYNVSVTCGNYNKTDGKCLSCASAEYILYVGLCIQTNQCGSRQWKDVLGNCKDVSQSCVLFNPSTGACISCIANYDLYSNGICCPDDFFPNSRGVCVAGPAPVSNNCLIYYSTMGCLECQSDYEISYTASKTGLGVCV